MKKQNLCSSEQSEVNGTTAVVAATVVAVAAGVEAWELAA